MCITWTCRSEPPWSTPRLSSASRRRHPFPGSHSPGSCCHHITNSIPSGVLASQLHADPPRLGLTAVVLSGPANPPPLDARSQRPAPGASPNCTTALRPPQLSPLYSAPVHVLHAHAFRPFAPSAICPVSISPPALGPSRAFSASSLPPDPIFRSYFVLLIRYVSHPTSLDIVPLPSLALALGLASSARRSTRQTCSWSCSLARNLLLLDLCLRCAALCLT
jgi:hypothetical protein